MFPTCPIDLELSRELAEREQWLASTRSRRVQLAQNVLRRCHWPSRLTTVRVLEPYVDFHHRQCWRIVPRQRMTFVQL